MEALETTYEQQADNFLTKTNTTFKSEFVKYDYYFEGDKEKRNVFGITLFKSNHQYKFNFGSSIADSCKFVKAPITEVKKEIDEIKNIIKEDLLNKKTDSTKTEEEKQRNTNIREMIGYFFLFLYILILFFIILEFSF